MNSDAHADQLATARELVRALENADDNGAQAHLSRLNQARETDLYQEVGKLTRELHESLNNFKLDSRLADITHKEMPDTRDRLNYVIETTEDAAHQTLTQIDATLPLATELKQTAEKIDDSWHRFRMRELSVDEFRILSREIEAYLPQVKTHAEAIHNNLSAMTMAQGFQDLTGQILRQVIDLVEEVETNLVRLVQVAGGEQPPSTGNKKRDNDPIKAEGPQINAKDNPDVVNNQDDVDDLLSSLGF